VDKLGAACLMYASDYPHGDMSWTKVPETRENPTLTDAEKDAILGGNAARFYQFPATGSLIGQGAAAVSRAG
jgi:predicted TIM-barrel fold metal-dependent hydrolase